MVELKVTQTAINNELKNGLCYVCANCNEWYEGKANGLDNCGKIECGSPMRRKNFPLYNGPLTEHLNKVCLFCGNQQVFAFIKVTGDANETGVCQKHLTKVDEYINSGDAKKDIFILPNQAYVLDEFRNTKDIL